MEMIDDPFETSAETDDCSAYSLRQALDIAARALQRALPDRFWVVAEIAQINSSKDNVYIDLVQKEKSGTIVAKTQAAIWQSGVRAILGAFKDATGQNLAAGMSALLCVSASFHAIYGFRFQIHAIDGDYTVGEMARQKREVIERLKREGLIDANKELPLPVVVQRIAVISSSTAAGYEDFVHEIGHNSAGYRFTHQLFDARMQGDEAESSLISALRNARRLADQFDAVILIRGGGSKTDLHCFDGYALAKELATFPIPVITGIGHERDDSIADMVAHTRCKTPTAVAELLIRRALDFEEALLELQMRVARAATGRLESCRSQLEAVGRRVQAAVTQAVSRRAQELISAQERLSAAVKVRIEREKGVLERIADKAALLDPINVLRRGYSLVYAAESGALLRAATAVAAGQKIRVRLAEGLLAAEVTEVTPDSGTGSNGLNERAKADGI